jgi:hypothetical protein
MLEIFSNIYLKSVIFIKHTCEHSRINILQWILTKLGTCLVLKRIWNPIDFQCHRSKVKVTGSNFYRISKKLKNYVILYKNVFFTLKYCKQGQRKAWCIPSKKKYNFMKNIKSDLFFNIMDVCRKLFSSFTIYSV